MDTGAGAAGDDSLQSPSDGNSNNDDSYTNTGDGGAEAAAGGARKGRQRLARELTLTPHSGDLPDPSPYVGNLVITSRYTLYNFLPRNLFEQLTEMSNFYFLCIGIMQAIPEISASNGIPTMYIPLAFILFVSGLRAAIEDYHRHETDKEEGNRIFRVFDEGGWCDIESSDLHVGHIVRIRSNQPVPADVLFLHSSNKRGHCFVETSNLDGETDLKPKISVSTSHHYLSHRVLDDALHSLEGKLYWEAPNKKLESFVGFMTAPGRGEDDPVQLNAENVLLRGTVLKNTEFVVGVVVYTGEDTKIRRNVKDSSKRLPRSTIMRIVNTCLIGMLATQFLLCVLAAILASHYHRVNQDDMFFLDLEGSSSFEGFQRFFTWFIILSQLVPISLLVSSEIVKTFQAYFINRDITIYDPMTNTPTQVRSNVINEDLGQVQFIFSDKTGTLTQNKMAFRVAMVGTTTYGSGETEISKRVKARMAELQAMKLAAAGSAIVKSPRAQSWTSLVDDLSARMADADQMVPFDARDKFLDDLWVSPDVEPGFKLLLRRYLEAMAISNTITPIFDEKTHEWVFQSSSPDELALCKFAQYMGFELVGRNPTRLRINKFGRGETEEVEYSHLATMGFNSKRKRVTLVYQQGQNIVLMSKGADSNMLPLIDLKHEDHDALMDSLLEMAMNGLRTLVVAYSDLSLEWWDEWKPTYQFISSLPERGTEAGHQKGNCEDMCRICQGLQDMEQAANMRLLGATAIEDRLQDLVPEAIEDFLEAGIRVWMLTGDKRETAKNIGLACNLIDPDMENPHDWSRSRLVEVTGQWCKILDDQAELKALFQVFDQNNDGAIDRDELLEFLMAVEMPLAQSQSSKKEIDGLFSAADLNHDDRIEFDEFVVLMRSTNLSMLEAVQSDVSQGLMVTKRFDPSTHPVSMIVEGSAFGVLYPANHEERQKQRQKEANRRNMWRLFRRQTRTSLSVAAGQDDGGDDVEREPQQFTPDMIDKLRDDFFELALRCKSVVCCRLTPYQKAKIVQEIKKRRGLVTLAIGDGANDESMIKEADVGVGISGLEGTAAARASAYSIGQFRFLHTLLFVHGHWSYRRIAKLVPYIFYKAIIPVLVMFWYGFFSHFSGQQLLNPLVYTFYNVIFTAAPIMVLAVLDQGLSRRACENNPRAYKALLGAAYFNPEVFSWWIVRSFVHSLILFFFTYGSIGIQDVALENGQVHGMWFFSSTIYAEIVVLATFRIVLEFVTITWIHQLFVWLSFGGFLLVMYIITLLRTFNLDMYGVVVKTYESSTVWLTIILTVAIPIIIDYTWEAYQREFRPTLPQVLQERDLMPEDEVSKLPENPDVAPAEELKRQAVHRRYSTFRSSRLVAIEIDNPSSPAAIELPQAERQLSAFSNQRLDAVMAHMLRFHNVSGSDMVENAACSQFLDLDEGSERSPPN